MEQAFSVSFAVHDESTRVVARGVVGGNPATVPEGSYRMAASCTETYQVKDVKVQGVLEIRLRIHQKDGRLRLNRTVR